MCRINDQKVAIVIFPSLPIGLESTDQSVGDTFRLSPPLAKAHSNPTLSLTTLRQRSDRCGDGLRRLSDIDPSPAVNDGHAYASCSTSTNPPNIPANTPPVPSSTITRLRLWIIT
mgnify:CR=1 FL=1